MFFATIFFWADRIWKTADMLVAADARRQGISMEEAWAGVGAATQMHVEQSCPQVLDLFDPLGWRAAALATQRAT